MSDQSPAAQCYEDTSGLTLGDPVVRTGKPLSVELGPGLLTNIYDGIQRPLKSIAQMSGDVFIPKGVDVPALDRKKQYEFKPKKVKVRGRARRMRPAAVPPPGGHQPLLGGALALAPAGWRRRLLPVAERPRAPCRRATG